MTTDLSTTAIEAMLTEVKYRQISDHYIESRYVGKYYLLSTAERDGLCAALRQLLDQNAELQRHLEEEKERADTNFASYERVKGLYSDASRQLKEARAEVWAKAIAVVSRLPIVKFQVIAALEAASKEEE